MIPYFLLLLFSVALPIIYYRPGTKTGSDDIVEFTTKRNKLTIRVFFVGLFALLALRDISVGIDLLQYEKIFVQCGQTEFSKLSDMQWELGYTIFNKVFYSIFKDYRLFLIMVAAVILLPIYKLYSEEEKNSFLLIILFLNMPCFLMIFSGLRQAIAMSIGICAYMVISKGRTIYGIFLIFVASSFHITALLLFLLFPAMHVKIKTPHLFYLVPLILVIYVARKPLLSLIISFMPARYIEFYGEIEETGAYGMLILFLLFCVFSFVISDENRMTEKDYFMRNVLLIATILQLFVPIHGLIQRASYYFLIFVPLSLLSVVRSPQKRLKEISNTAIIVMTSFFCIYFFYRALYSSDNMLGVFPYKFFWGR